MKIAQSIERHRVHLRAGLVVISVFIPSLIARGQEALRSALAVDQSTRPAANVGEGAFASVRLGPFLGHLSLYGSASYNDNINAAETGRKSDEIIDLGTSASFIMPVGDQSQLSVNFGVGYATYLQHSYDSTLTIAPDSYLNWDISFPDGYLSLFDSLTYTSQVYDEGALANITELPRWDDTAGTRITWTPGRWILQTGYSYDKVFTTASSDAYLNWDTQDLFLRAGWFFAEKTQAGIEASASFTSYESGNQSATTSYSIGAYTDWQITQYLRTELRGGPTVYHLGSSSVGSTTELNSYYLDVGIYDQLTEHLSQSLIVQRSVQLGLNPGSQYLEDFLATYAISWTATSRTVAGLSATYEDGYQPLPTTSLSPIVVTEHFKRYGGGPQITWLITNHASSILSYYFWLRSSDQPNRNYVDNSVTLSLNYSF